jgi:hypothetical protein
MEIVQKDDSYQITYSCIIGERLNNGIIDRIINRNENEINIVRDVVNDAVINIMNQKKFIYKKEKVYPFIKDIIDSIEKVNNLNEVKNIVVHKTSACGPTESNIGFIK